MITGFSKLDLKTHESLIKYKTDNVKSEFFSKLTQHLEKAQNNQGDYINRCQEAPELCQSLGWSDRASAVDKALSELSGIGGIRTNFFPNVTFLRVKVDGSVKNDMVYTIIRNKSYLNVSSLMASEDIRLPAEDTIDVVPGFVGAYPNFFIQIDKEEVGDFVEQYKAVKSFENYHSLVDKYGVRRTNPDFWEVSDWFYKKHQYDNNVYAGLFDLNRYKNR